MRDTGGKHGGQAAAAIQTASQGICALVVTQIFAVSLLLCISASGLPAQSQLIPTQDAELSFVATGSLSVTNMPFEKPINSSFYTFQFEVSGKHWSMMVTNETRSFTSMRHLGSDGKSTFAITSNLFGPESTVPLDIRDKVNNQISVDDSMRPPAFDPDMSLLWLAWASMDTIRTNLSKTHFPWQRGFDPDGLPDKYRSSVTWIDDEKKMFPLNILYSVPGNFRGSKTGKLFQFPEPYDNGFLWGHYRVIEITNISRYSIPVAFELVRNGVHLAASNKLATLLPMSIGLARATVRLMEPSERVNLPSAKKGAEVVDFRHRMPEIGYEFLQYTLDDDSWKSIDDPKLLEKLRSETEVALDRLSMGRIALRRERMMWWVFVILITGGTLSILAKMYSNKTKSQ